MTAQPPQLYVVTGGNGFLGSHVVNQILNAEKRPAKIAIFDLQADNVFLNSAEDDGSAGSLWKQRESSIQFYKTDVTNRTELMNNLKSFLGSGNATEQPELTVFHTASLVSLWIDYHVIHRVNVTGTEILVDSLCELLDSKLVNKVKFIYTSSNTVQMEFGSFEKSPTSGHRESFIDNEDGSRQYTYPESASSSYIATKRLAEKYILSKNGSCQGKLLTCSVRPSGVIYGPDSTVHKQMVLSYKKNHVKVGGATDDFNISYVENVAYAHVLCSQHMNDSSDKPCGRAYFVGDSKGHYYTFFVPLYESIGLKNPSLLDYRILLILGYIACFVCMLVNLVLPKKMAWRPFTVPIEIEMIIYPFYCSHQSATEDFGYKPIVSEKEAIQRTVQNFIAWNKKLESGVDTKDRKIL